MAPSSPTIPETGNTPAIQDMISGSNNIPNNAVNIHPSPQNLSLTALITQDIISDNLNTVLPSLQIPSFTATSTMTSESIGNNLQINQPATSATTAELTLLSEEITASTQSMPVGAKPKVTQPPPSPDMSAAIKDDNFVMGDLELNGSTGSSGSPLSELCLPQKDDNLPPWLMLTIEYLRNVSKENAWQNLVTEFITFEKSGPPAGVSLIVIAMSNITLNIILFLFFHRNCRRHHAQEKYPTGSRARRRITSLLLSQAVMDHR